MKKNLFFICPDCHLEHFIKEKYDDNVFFVTALGTVFNFDDINYSKSLSDFIIRESITDIFIVNDTSCRFINNVLEKEKSFETFSEEVLQNVLNNNFAIIMDNKFLVAKTQVLAEFNSRRQINEITTNEMFSQQSIQGKISIKGIVSTKAENKWIELI